MTDAAVPSGIGCGACAVAGTLPRPDVPPVAADAHRLRRIELSLPSIHCANCIAGVERSLGSSAEVAGARVNLTLKRVSITAADTPGVEERLIALLGARGWEARPLDSAVLEATRTDAEGRALLARIGVAGFALMNVMLLSIAVWSGADASTRDLMHWISAAIALPAVAFAAQPFFANALRALRAGRLDMDVPISTAILLALGVSVTETLQSGENAFFDAALMLTFFLLIGRYLAHLTRAAARSAAAEVAALEVHSARRLLADGTAETVPLDALREGDTLLVAPGQYVPADGTVILGHSELDTSMLTGETMPAGAGPGTVARAGMVNISGPLHIRVEALGEDTVLRQIARLVESAEQSRSRYSNLASRASGWYSHVVNVLAVTALFGWGLIGGDWRVAFNIAAAVLIITCPCALGLAVPAVLTTASGRLFRNGVLLKDGDALERLAQIDTVVFDKTGTLTTGTPVLVAMDALSTETLALAAALAAGSAHPLSRAICTATADLELPPVGISGTTEYPGLGTEAWWNGERVRLGRAAWVDAPQDKTRTTTWLQRGDRPAVPLEFEDQLRPDAPATIARLRDNGLSVEILSGDTAGPVAAMAGRLGIATWTAAVTPEEKVAKLKDLSAAGHKVLMVGDGLNDTAALAAAHVSMSPASAIDASRTASDLIILGGRLRPVVDTWWLARRARRRVLENFALAFAYNIVTVPVAFAGLVTPLIAAIAMSASSVLVSLNAMRLGRTE